MVCHYRTWVLLLVFVCLKHELKSLSFFGYFRFRPSFSSYNFFRHDGSCLSSVFP
ncbi:hypothetical protein M758_5G127600 [Ceratodon purpureus]|uniref:Uncharacterized protein n=1 Tax=Ceratodon purpureus TaxID=3225 RepID=A0A8T0HZS9_CERPU|nr:hypothetical protein KC19_5G098700 [Ceratodon purpureus]KAG0616607.1 hypothetical protein M758_5G127600 [Ceratodon purpureus]